MSAELFMFRAFGSKNEQASTPKRKGVVTGIQERSEVEAMIHRYMELAATVLDDDSVSDCEERFIA